MFYVILEKTDLKYLNSLTNDSFNEIENSIIDDTYCLVYSKKDYLSLYEILKRNKCKGIAIQPYLSKKIFENIYPKELYKRMNPVKLSYSLFDLLIASHSNQIPTFDEDYYLLSDIQPSINGNKLLLNIKRFNELLGFENLLISVDNILPSLKSIFARSVEKILIAEANEENIRLKDSEIYNKNFNYLVITEFIINASYIYNKKEIEEFLVNEIGLERD